VSLTRVVAWNTAVQVGGRAVGLVASVVVTALLTRHLGLGAYGQLVAASTYIAVFTILGDAGLYLSTVRRAAQAPAARPAVLGTALGLRLVMAAVLLALGCVLVLLVPADRFPTWVPAVKLAVAVCAVNAYVTLQSQLLIAVFRLHLRMDLAVLGEVLARVVVLVAVGVVVATGGGLVAACVALACGTVANFVYAWVVTRRFERFRPQLDLPLARAMLSESVALTIVTLLGLVHFKVDTLMLSFMQPAADVGIYGVAYKVHEVLITFPGLFVGLLFPLYARLAGTDEARLRQVFQRSFDVLLLSSVGAALLVVALAPALAAFLGAPAAAPAMRVLSLALVPVFVSLGFTHLLLAEGRQTWLVRLYVVLVVANIAGNAVAIRRWTYHGAAAMTVATETLSLVCLLAYWLGRRRWRLELRALWSVPIAVALAWLGDAALTRLGASAVSGATKIAATAALGGAIGLVYAAAVVRLRLLPAASLRALWPGRSAERDGAES
jgi:O-antigen/teichoic acid export membrane protein